MKTAADIALLLIRVIPGILLFAFHGLSKLTSAFAMLFQGKDWRFVEGVERLGFPAPVFFAVCAALAEGVGSLMLVAGLFTRYAALFICITMLVAVYRHMTTDGRFELALMYAVVAIAFMLMHPGRFSLDAMRGKRNSGRAKS